MTSSMFGPNQYARGEMEIEDTGWVTVTLTDTTNFDLYGTQPIRFRVISRVAYLHGALNLQTPGYIDTTTSRVFATLPTEARPAAPQNPVFACQGSSENRWALRVFQDGTLSAERYGPSASGAGTWLPFTVQWVVG
jgi:hypothetical protein